MKGDPDLLTLYKERYADGMRQLKMLGDGKKVVYETEKPIAAKLRKVNNV